LEAVMAVRRLPAVLAAAAVAATACGGSSAAPERNPQPAGEPDPLVYRGQLVEVLPRDAIPSIDEPRFITPEDAEPWLAGREPVIALEVAGDARAYPVQILTRHEIVNDLVGGQPVAVTYCPLCNSAVAFRRQVDGRVLEFGVSGKLHRSALVMYDRQTESLWTHFDGVAVQGPLTGTRLELLPTQLLSFHEWRRASPAGRVLSRDTGHFVEYGTNPYEYYERGDGPYGQFFRQAVNHRLPAMARVVGITVGGTDIAYPYRDLSDRSEGAAVVEDDVEGRRIVIFWAAGTASALDAPVIAEGRDVGATGVFVAQAGERPLTFTVKRGRIVDRQTSSSWSVAGQAVDGPLRGQRLEPIAHLDSFWFAWQAYRPGTLVYGADA
jgi:hypothetical protein